MQDDSAEVQKMHICKQETIWRRKHFELLKLLIVEWTWVQMQSSPTETNIRLNRQQYEITKQLKSAGSTKSVP